MSSPLTKEELLKLDIYYNSPITFINECVQIYDNVSSSWIPFRLYDFQIDMINNFHNERLNIVLKARQIGASLCALSYNLWMMLFRPVAHILVFSRRETDARYLIGHERMRGMYHRLPDFVKGGAELIKDSASEFALANGSHCHGMSTKGGDGHSSTSVIIDEASIIEDLSRLMVSVKPTIDQGGKMQIVSRANKQQPNSEFNNMYKAASAELTPFNALFYPWDVVPYRTRAWYEGLSVEIETRTGSLDDLYQNYPATEREALQPPTSNRRLPFTLLNDSFEELNPIPEHYSGVYIKECDVYKTPLAGSKYVIGVDVAEGGTGDYTSATVLNKVTGEQVAQLREKIEADAFGEKLVALSYAYNFAHVLIERNSVGTALIQYMKRESKCVLLHGMDGKIGWHTNTKTKPVLYSVFASDLWDQAIRIHDPITFHELASIEANTLRAPKSGHDDAAMSMVIANRARHIESKKRTTTIVTRSL